MALAAMLGCKMGKNSGIWLIPTYLELWWKCRCLGVVTAWQLAVAQLRVLLLIGKILHQLIWYLCRRFSHHKWDVLFVHQQDEELHNRCHVCFWRRYSKWISPTLGSPLGFRSDFVVSSGIPKSFHSWLVHGEKIRWRMLWVTKQRRRWWHCCREVPSAWRTALGGEEGLRSGCFFLWNNETSWPMVRMTGSWLWLPCNKIVAQLLRYLKKGTDFTDSKNASNPTFSKDHWITRRSENPVVSGNYLTKKNFAAEVEVFWCLLSASMRWGVPILILQLEGGQGAGTSCREGKGKPSEVPWKPWEWIGVLKLRLHK